MAENLLNFNAYVGKISEQTSTPKKTYMDSSSTFDNVFNNVNKAYDTEKKLSDAAATEKFVEKENFNKIDENKSYDDSHRIKENDENNTSKEEVSRKSDDDKDSEDSDKADNSDNKDESSAKKDSEDKPKVADGSEILLQEKPATTPVALGTAAEALISQAVSLLTKTIQQDQPAAETTKPAEQAVKASKPEEKLDVDLSKLVQGAKDIVKDVKNIKAKVQSEVQQVLLNMKVEPEANVAQADASDLKGAADIKTQAPLIQANAEVVAKAEVGPAPKKVLKEILEKAALNQDILDKTNATVVSVQTSASSDNLLNQQNAKEQGVKLSLESTSSNNSSNAASAANLNAQVTFDKRIEGAQQPKEINKTDVLSQIHTKMEQLKDTGTTRVTIVLKPENLGKINLELINSKDGFTARMTTDNAQVKELLDKNLDSLKSSLASQGVNVGNVTVKVAEVEKQPSEMFSFDQKQTESQEHQASSNSNNTGGSYGERNSQGYFEEEIINTAGSEFSGESESLVAHDGQVDYKI